RSALVIGTGAILLSAAFLPLRTWRVSYAHMRHREAVVSAANALPYRLIDSRLAGPFAYRPLLKVRGSVDDASSSGRERLGLIVAAKRLQPASATSASAADALAVAEADLAL